MPRAIGAGPSPSPIPQGCQLRSPQPDAPLRLNAVAVSNFVKTIAVQKEIFNCYDAQSNLATVKDVETVVETVERGDLKGKGRRSSHHSAGRWDGGAASMTTVAESVEADTCTKNLQTGRVGCTSQPVPLGVADTPLAKCTVTKGTYPFDTIQQPGEPLGMSTVALDNGLVKTVDVENEVFACSGQIGDLYLFHDNVELQSGNGFRPVSSRFEGVMCFKNEATAQVTSCKLVTPGASA